jgi:hypothetical protein
MPRSTDKVTFMWRYCLDTRRKRGADTPPLLSVSDSWAALSSLSLRDDFLYSPSWGSGCAWTEGKPQGRALTIPAAERVVESSPSKLFLSFGFNSNIPKLLTLQRKDLSR